MHRVCFVRHDSIDHYFELVKIHGRGSKCTAGASKLTIALDSVAGAQLVVGTAVHVLPVLTASTATTMTEALSTSTALLAPAASLLVRIFVVAISVLTKLVFPRFLVVVDKFTDQVAELQESNHFSNNKPYANHEANTCWAR
jgi:hypothetical protein